MAQQEEGWPLGMEPSNERVGFGVRNNIGEYSTGSVSFNTLFGTGVTSPTSSTDSSSDLDTQSTGSFFQDRSITLGSLIGVSNIIDLSRNSKSSRVRKIQVLKEKRSYKKPKTWIFSLCSRDKTDADHESVKNYTITNGNININNNPPSLGHFLAVERIAAAAAIHNEQLIQD